MNGIQDCQKSEFAQNVSLLTGIEKKCKKCNCIKTINNYHKDKNNKDGHGNICKLCQKQKFNKYYSLNKEKILLRNKQWRMNNSERYKKSLQEWRCNNENYYINYRKNNLDKIKSNFKEWAKTPKNKLNRNISSAIRRSLKSKKPGHWEEVVGFKYSELIKRIEPLLLEGMSMENYGAWHIDHIIPVSAHNFQTPEDIDFKKCWSLKNLQPMWAIDNFKKHNKLTKPFQPSLIF